MKLRHSLLAAALFAVVSTNAAAQVTTGVVNINGSIVPATCTVSIDNSGVFDLGQIDYLTLNQNTIKDIGNYIQPTTVSCSGPTLMAFMVTDNKNGTAAGGLGYQFGLGVTSTSVNVGHFKLQIVSPVVDTVSQPVIESSNLTSWATVGVPWWPKEQAGGLIYRSFGSAAGPVPVTTATFDLRLSPSINSRNALRITQDEAVDGSATLEIVYI